MKKIFFLLYLIIITAFAFAQNGVILDLSGEVEIKHSGSADFIAASVGDQVREDAVISTGFRSNALVEVGSTVFTVRPLTRLTLTEIRLSSGEETVNANLQAGRVRVEVSPPAGTRTSMQVSSPSATASVRGTVIDFDGYHLSSTEGTGELQGNWGPSVLVGENFAAGLTHNGLAGDAFYYGGGGGTAAPGDDDDLGEDGGFLITVTGDGNNAGGVTPQGTVGTDSGSSVGDISLPPVTSPNPPVPNTPTPPPVTPPSGGGGSSGGGGGNGGYGDNGGGGAGVNIDINWGP